MNELISGFTEAEQVREFFKDNPAGIDHVLERVRNGTCPCCGMKQHEDQMVTLDCGHVMCDYFCYRRNHECIPCALAV